MRRGRRLADIVELVFIDEILRNEDEHRPGAMRPARTGGQIAADRSGIAAAWRRASPGPASPSCQSSAPPDTRCLRAARVTRPPGRRQGRCQECRRTRAGVVTLTAIWPACGRRRRRLCNGRHLPPLSHRVAAELAECSAGDQMALDVEEVVDGRMDGEEPLRGRGRFEPLHLSLSSSHRLM